VQEQLDRALRERDEALDQQTATAEILRTINESAGDLTPVFDTMVESAMRLCQADYGHVYSYDGKLLHLVAAHGDPRYVNWIKDTKRISLIAPHMSAFGTKRTSRVALQMSAFDAVDGARSEASRVP